MGPSGAMEVERSASRPCSQSLSGFCAISSWAQAATSATSERIKMAFCIGELLRIRASKKSRSAKLERRQGDSADRVEQGAIAIGAVDGPGDFQNGADALLPGDVE